MYQGWMGTDLFRSDFHGATNVGMRALLLRRPGETSEDNLTGVDVITCLDEVLDRCK